MLRNKTCKLKNVKKKLTHQVEVVFGTVYVGNTFFWRKSFCWLYVMKKSICIFFFYVNGICYTIEVVENRHEQELTKTIDVFKIWVFWFLTVYHYQSNILSQTISKYISLSITVKNFDTVLCWKQIQWKVKQW